MSAGTKMTWLKNVFNKGMAAAKGAPAAIKGLPGAVEKTWGQGAQGKAKVIGGALGGLGLMAGAGKGISSLMPSSYMGRKQMLEDANTKKQMFSNAGRAALLGLGGAGLLTGLSHVMRSNQYDDSYDELTDRMPVYLGKPPKKRKRRQAKEASAPFMTDQKAWDAAPSSSGKSLLGGDPWKHKLSLPLAILGAGGGIMGGKYLADKIGYGLRGRRVKKRVQDAEEEFNEAVDTMLKKRASLNNHIDSRYSQYKKEARLGAGALVGGGMTLLGLMSALTAYNRYKGDSVEDVYRDRVLRYVPQATQPLVDVVDPSFDEEPGLKKKDLNKSAGFASSAGSGAAAGGIIGGGVGTLFGPGLGTAIGAGVGGAVGAGVGVVGHGLSRFTNSMGSANDAMRGASGPEARAKLTGPYEKAFNPPSAEGGAAAVNAVGDIMGNSAVQDGMFEGIMDKMPWLNKKRASLIKAALELYADGDIWGAGDAGKGMQQEKEHQWWNPMSYARYWGQAGKNLYNTGAAAVNSLTDAGAQQNVASRVEPGIVNTLRSTADKMKHGDTARRFGKGLVSGGTGSSFASAATNPQEKAVAEGVGEGIDQSIGSRNPATDLALKGAQRFSQGKPPGTAKAAATNTPDPDLNSALNGPLRTAGRNAGKHIATAPGGINDNLTEKVVPRFVNEHLAPRLGSRLGGAVKNMFAGNSGWGNAFGMMGNQGNTMEDAADIAQQQGGIQGMQHLFGQ